MEASRPDGDEPAAPLDAGSALTPRELGPELAFPGSPGSPGPNQRVDEASAGNGNTGGNGGMGNPDKVASNGGVGGVVSDPEGEPPAAVVPPPVEPGCSAPGWVSALPHDENLGADVRYVMEGLAVDVRAVLGEYDVQPVTAQELEVHPIVLRISPEPGFDYRTDGVDDQEQLNQATTRVRDAGGGVVYLQAGVYTVSANVDVWDNTTLLGQGRVGARRTVIRLADSAPSMSDEAGIVRLKRVKNVHIRDLVVDGNRDNQALGDDEKKHGIYVEGEDVLVRRVTARECSGFGVNVQGQDDGASTASIADSFVTENFSDGIAVEATANSLLANNTSFGNGGHGISIADSSHDLSVCGNHIQQNGGLRTRGAGIQVQNGSEQRSSTPVQIEISGNSISSNARSGIELRTAQNCVVSRNLVDDNAAHGVRLRAADKNQIVGNVISNNGTEDETAFELLYGDYALRPGGPLNGSDDNSSTNNLFVNKLSRWIGWEVLGIGNTESDNQRK